MLRRRSAGGPAITRNRRQYAARRGTYSSRPCAASSAPPAQTGSRGVHAPLRSARTPTHPSAGSRIQPRPGTRWSASTSEGQARRRVKRLKGISRRLAQRWRCGRWRWERIRAEPSRRSVAADAVVVRGCRMPARMASPVRWQLRLRGAYRGVGTPLHWREGAAHWP